MEIAIWIGLLTLVFALNRSHKTDLETSIYIRYYAFYIVLLFGCPILIKLRQELEINNNIP